MSVFLPQPVLRGKGHGQHTAIKVWIGRGRLKIRAVIGQYEKISWGGNESQKLYPIGDMRKPLI